MLFAIAAFALHSIARSLITAHKARHQITILQNTLQGLLTTIPAPTLENVEKSSNGFNDFRSQLESFSLEMFHSPTLDPLAFQEDLQAFVNALKVKLKRHKIALGEHCHFGFSRYLETNALPPSEALPLIYSQSIIIEYLLHSLIEANPHTLLSVEREDLEAPFLAEPTSRGSNETFSASTKKIHLNLDPKAFRLSFIGTTGTLRTFFNELKYVFFPLQIQDIDVQRAPATSYAGLNSFSIDSPLINPLSVFTITIQSFEPKIL